MLFFTNEIRVCTGSFELPGLRFASARHWFAPKTRNFFRRLTRTSR